MSYHSDWKKIKGKARNIPKGFFKGADFGKKLDEFEKADAAVQKNKNPDKEEKLKQKAKKALAAALVAQADYLKITKMAQNQKANSPALLQDIDQLLTDWMPLMNALGKEKARYGL